MSSLPNPLPPRTPTPPPEDSSSSAGSGPDGFMLSPAQSQFDGLSLSPMNENFMPSRQSSIPSIVTTTIPLAEQDTNSFGGLHTPMTADSGASMGSKRSSLMVEDHNGVFNFQPGLMAKAPVAKSVSIKTCPIPTYTHTDTVLNRAWGNAAATNTNIQACPTNFSSNHPLDLLLKSQTPFRCLLLKNADAPCRPTKTSASTGP